MKMYEGKQKKLQNLREKLLRKSKEDLWFAQLVQNGLLREYINILITENYTITEIKRKIKLIYEKINNFAYFIQEKDSDETIKKEILRLVSSKPEILLISSKGVAASNLRHIKPIIIDQHKETYKYRISEDEHKLLMFFLLKSNA